MERELLLQQFVQQEEGIFHPTYDSELEFYELVGRGEIEQLKEKQDYGDVDMPARGILSKNNIRNLRYHIIVTIAMISRFCIERGLDEGESYSLSDYYIRRVDECEQEAGLRALHQELILDYAKRMRQLRKKKIHSIHCVRAVDYIRNHLYESIQLQQVADYVNLERTYFCRLFRQEMGISFVDYVVREKISVAKNMLAYSSYSCGEIAQYLGFSSGSHFGRVFKQHIGRTPNQYREENYRRYWTKE